MKAVKKAKYLIQAGTNNVYIYTDILAQRKDMTPTDFIPTFEEEKEEEPVVDEVKEEVGLLSEEEVDTVTKPKSTRWTKKGAK